MKALEEIDINIKKDNIIDNIMKSKGLYCLVSNAKVGKSMLALQLSNSLVYGKQFLGHNTMSSPVLYISTESDSGQIMERIKTLGLTFPNDSFFIIDRNGKGKISIFDFEVDLLEFSKYKNGKFIIIDMLKDTDLGIEYDINSYQDVGQKLLPKLRSICEKYDVTILFTHHLNKRGTILGSTAFDAVVDGKLTLIENKNDKSLVRLNIINRDFPELNIQLKKSNNQIFNVINSIEDEDIDFNLIQLIKYASNHKDFEFTCTDIINKLNLITTPKRFGRLLNSNLDLLKKEGLIITKDRQSNSRNYIVHYEEPIDENE